MPAPSSSPTPTCSAASPPFDQLGSFNRQAAGLARLRQAKSWRRPLTQVAATPAAGGAISPTPRTAASPDCPDQSMLVNRSPLLEDMTTEALTRLRADPSTAPHHAQGLLRHSQGDLRARARRPAACAAARGNARPRSRGCPRAWAELSRALVRHFYAHPEGPRHLSAPCMAKAGRWLAAEHPEIAEPAAVDPADLRGLGRGGGPDGMSATTSSGPMAGLSKRGWVSRCRPVPRPAI